MSITGRSIRILLVNHVGKISGAESSMISLISALDKSKYELFAAVPSGELADKLVDLGVTVVSIREWRPRRRLRPYDALKMVAGWAAGISRTARLIKSLDIDIVHSNSTPAHILAAPSAILCGAPPIWHVRDMISLSGLGRILSRCSSRIIAISDAVKEGLVLQGIEKKKIIRVYNGIDVETIRSEAELTVEEPPGIPPGARCVTMAAQLVPWKRQDDFIRAFGKIAQHYPETICLVVGEDIFADNPDYCRHLRNVADQTGFPERIIFTGRRDDVPAIIARSEMLVMPSIREPFGRVALEAMALGKPVIGTDSGGLPELISHNASGILVNTKDVNGLAAAIGKLLDNRELAEQMGELGVKRAKSIFSSNAHADCVSNIYEELLRCAKGLRK